MISALVAMAAAKGRKLRSLLLAPARRLDKFPSPSSTGHTPAAAGYRADIDALRAAAVLLVIAYHWEVRPFRGGYIGVDVFFVISGFLITKLILDEQEAKIFSLRRFYVRRVRRLAPALLLVLATVFSAAWITLSPKGLSDICWGIISTLSFSANVLFWSQSDYFAGNVQENALLHMWSLAVEEQFYLIYPPLLVIGLASSCSRRGNLGWVLGAGIACSLAISMLLTFTSPASAFFFLPSRAWELLLGAALAASRLEAPSQRGARHGFAACGWAIILVAATAYSRRTSFPGFAALLPCVGSALIIWTGTGRTGSGRGLAVPAALGRISYGAYLWHWPLYAFAVHLHDGARVGAFPKLVLLSLTLAASLLSYRVLERPCRDPRIVATAQVITAITATALVLAAASVTSVLLGGIPSRYPKDLASIARFENYDVKALYSQHACWLMPDDDPKVFDLATCIDGDAGLPALLLWGDSTGAHYAKALQQEVASSRRTIQATAAACPPFVSSGPKDSTNPRCAAFNGKVLSILEDTRPSSVVLAGHWQAYALALGSDAFIARLQETVHDIVRRRSQVIIIGPPIQFNATLPSLIYKYGVRGLTVAREPWLEARSFSLDRDMRNVFKNVAGVTYISVLDSACPNRMCPVFAVSGVPIAWDTVHLTAEGSRLVVERIGLQLHQALSTPKPDAPEAGP